METGQRVRIPVQTGEVREQFMMGSGAILPDGTLPPTKPYVMVWLDEGGYACVPEDHTEPIVPGKQR